MQDDRQIKAPRQLQLRAVKLLLPRRVQPRHKVIEADFAHRHQMRGMAHALYDFPQRRHVIVPSAAGVERMDTQRVAVAVALR